MSTRTETHADRPGCGMFSAGAGGNLPPDADSARLHRLSRRGAAPPAERGPSRSAVQRAWAIASRVRAYRRATFSHATTFHQASMYASRRLR